MINVTVRHYNKTATLKIEGTAARKQKGGIKNANLVLLDSADHFMVNGEEANKTDISFYQLIVAVYLTMKREKTEQAALREDAVKSDALRIITNAARMGDVFRTKASRN
jgi:hypothetical protein